MPSWSSRLLPSYQPQVQQNSHTHSNSAGGVGTTVESAGSSSGNSLPGGDISRLPGAHSRSHSYQVTTSGAPVGTGATLGRSLGVKGRSSDGALKSDIGGERSMELTTGKCMCCDSSVRWPKHLSIFRCMICLTINDLKPIPHAEGKPAVPPISIEETGSIIDHCIAGFLRDRRSIKAPFPQASSSPSATMTENSPAEVQSTPTTTARPSSLKRSSGEPSPLVPGIISQNNATASSSGPTSPHQMPMPGLLDEEKQSFRTSLSFTPPEGNRTEFYSIVPPTSKTPLIVGNAELSFEDKEIAGYAAQYLPADALGHSQRRKQERDLAETMFRPLEAYIMRTFTAWESLNDSFFPQPTVNPNPRPDHGKDRKYEELAKNERPLAQGEYEKQMLLTGNRRKERDRHHHRENGRVNIKSPMIQWDAVKDWYEMIINAGTNILAISNAEGLGSDSQGIGEALNEKMKEKEKALDEPHNVEEAEQDLIDDVEEARAQLIGVLLKATEAILKRPGRPLKEPDDIRWLLIILANPLLYPSYSWPKPPTKKPSIKERKSSSPIKGDSSIFDQEGSAPPKRVLSTNTASGPGQHSGIVKRIMGLISILPNICHHYLVSWFSRLPEDQFRKIVELGGSFITYRLTRQQRKRPLTGTIGGGKRGKGVIYHDDWQIRAAARFMALLFSANNSGRSKATYTSAPYSHIEHDNLSGNPAELARRQAQARGQIIPTSDFYNMLLDYADLIADFDSWENRAGKFCFCQYPFLFSMGAKIHILEYDARRQMEVKAREAFFSSLTNRRAVNQYLVLKVRRDCLVEDSLKGISEGVGGMGDIKKGLRIEFVGEDGVDAGGLRKEWFLLLVRDVFDPNYGLFVYDEDSRYCYFNPNSFESSEEFFLIGVVFGLAIYNSTILDVALPPCTFKKLLMPSSGTSHAAASSRLPHKRTLDDLAVFRPALARGLSQLLEFEGDVEEIFCRNFVVDVDRFGQKLTIPLIPDGENIPVTNTNRKDFVDKYVTYILDTSVAKQFEPFKRGFYTVCGGNALSLFRPEEIELLIRGSEEPLDVSALRAVAIYEGWGNSNNNTSDAANHAIAENDPVVKWFWSFFERITPKEQRLLLVFITGSDRIPAMGATNLVIKLVCLGGDCDRFPVARTCFNALCLYRYKRREKLEKMLWRAVEESEGFGLK